MKHTKKVFAGFSAVVAAVGAASLVFACGTKSEVYNSLKGLTITNGQTGLTIESNVAEQLEKNYNWVNRAKDDPQGFGNFFEIYENKLPITVTVTDENKDNKSNVVMNGDKVQIGVQLDNSDDPAIQAYINDLGTQYTKPGTKATFDTITASTDATGAVPYYFEFKVGPSTDTNYYLSSLSNQTLNTDFDKDAKNIGTALTGNYKTSTYDSFANYFRKSLVSDLIEKNYNVKLKDSNEKTENLFDFNNLDLVTVSYQYLKDSKHHATEKMLLTSLTSFKLSDALKNINTGLGKWSAKPFDSKGNISNKFTSLSITIYNWNIKSSSDWIMSSGTAKKTVLAPASMETVFTITNN